MKISIIAGMAAASVLLAGCSRQISPERAAGSPAKGPVDTESTSNETLVSAAPMALAASSPVTQPVLAAWQEGDKPRAISLFVESDWAARPTFASGMALSLSEDQFKALSEADRELKAKEMMAQIDLIKQLAAAVAQAGREAAANGDSVQARKCFTSLKQFGATLNAPDRLRLIQLVGQVSQKMADNELAKIGK